MSNRRSPRNPPSETCDLAPYGPEGTDFEQEDVALVVDVAEDGRRQAVILPRSLSRLGREARAEARDLQQLGLELMRVADAIDAQVYACREAGVSWAGIGWALGTTGENARKRWAE